MNLANATPQAALLADIVAGSPADHPGLLWRHRPLGGRTLVPAPPRPAAAAAVRRRAGPRPAGDRVPDLALVTETLERLPRETGALLLGQLRNYGTREIAVLVHASAPWTFTDFLGLGFRRQARLPSDPDLTLYSYNLDSYNHTRTWNNPEHWANPHMWGKAWW